MSVSRPFELTVGDRTLDGVLDFPGRDEPRPVVVVYHGFKAFFEWGFYPPLAELLTARGFVVVRFNFSGSGMLPGEELATDLEGFRQATFSRDLEDVLAILEAAAGDELARGRIDPERLALLGHSRGGGAAILAAAADKWRERLKALVTWAAVATFDRYDEELKAHWRERGEWIVVNGRTGQELPVSSEVLDDLEANAASLDLEAAASRRRAPWLIVHGDDDETVAIEDAARLRAAAAEPTRLEIVAGGGHTFGARHPFAGPTPALIEAMNHSQRWLREHL